VNIILFRPDESIDFIPGTDFRARHIIQTLRCAPGDTIRCGTIGGNRFSTRILSLDPDGIRLERVAGSETPPIEGVPLHLLIGHPRPLVLQRILKDVSSLGAASIGVFAGELTEKSYLSSSMWNDPERYLLEGASQGGLTTVPVLHKYYSIDQAVAEISAGTTILVADLPGGREDDHRIERLCDVPTVSGNSGLCIVVGPERGFSRRERAFLTPYATVSLGRTVLRTEAAVIAVSVLLTQLLRRNAG